MQRHIEFENICMWYRVWLVLLHLCRENTRPHRLKVCGPFGVALSIIFICVPVGDLIHEKNHSLPYEPGPPAATANVQSPQCVCVCTRVHVFDI